MPLEFSNGDVMEVKFYCRSQGQSSINTRHYRFSDKAGTGPTPEQVLSALTATYPGLFQSLMSDDAVYQGTTIQVVNPVRSIAYASTIGAGDGNVAGDQLPRQTCGLIALRSDLSARPGRGRIYVPFPSETDNKPVATPSDDYLANLTTLAESLIVEFNAGVGGNTGVFTPCMYGRVTRDTYDLTNFVVRPYWATQRRRSDAKGGDLNPF